MTSAVTHMPLLALPWERSEDFGWGFAKTQKAGNFTDRFKSQWVLRVADVLPRPASDDTVDGAISQPKALGDDNLLFSFFHATNDFSNRILRELLSPASRSHRIANVLSVGKPLKVIDAIILRIVVLVGHIGEMLRVRYEGIRNKSMYLKLAHDSILAEHNNKSTSLSPARIIKVGFQEALADAAAVYLVPKVPPSFSLTHPLKTLDAAETADGVQAIVSCNGLPFLIHNEPLSFVDGHDVMDANYKVKVHPPLDRDFRKSGDISCL